MIAERDALGEKLEEIAQPFVELMTRQNADRWRVARRLQLVTGGSFYRAEFMGAETYKDTIEFIYRDADGDSTRLCLTEELIARGPSAVDALISEGVRAESKAREEALARAAEERDRSERDQLVRLLAKYGPPTA